jgi:hypothetical protein
LGEVNDEDGDDFKPGILTHVSVTGDGAFYADWVPGSDMYSGREDVLESDLAMRWYR